MLQWGRGSMTAERLTRFPAVTQLLFASMGPRFNDRGKSDRRGEVPEADRASMGPRFNDRGKDKADRLWSLAVRLQWGRGSMTAESRRMRWPSQTISRFNGAAVQ